MWRRLVFPILLVSGWAVVAGVQSARPDYPFRPVPFTSVHLNDSFWAPRIETNRAVTIPAAFQQCERTQRVYHFERAAKALRGEPLDDKKPPNYPFDDSDLYKVIEGAAYTLSVTPDPQLDAYVDGLIAKIAAAQEPDGYIYTTRTIDPRNPHPWAGPERWVFERNDSHELYNMGHLIEAAVAHHIATGKRNFLNVAIRVADLLVKTFGPGKRSTWPGHQITEMALVRLYRVTNNDAYLSLAKFLLDERGPGPDPSSPTRFPNGERAHPRGLEYNQAQLRIIDQTEPVGHAVRAMYMYAGMADVAALTNDADIRATGNRLWQNLITSKLYLTGGVGAAGGFEGFGKPYELPNLQAYNETCASVGMDYWNHRLFLLEGDAKFIDVMERTLYNGLISGVSLDGKTFFYPNPLESVGQHSRREWFGVACCPGNITRFLASVPGYLYATRGDEVYVNLFAGGTANIDLPGGPVKIVQSTRYPWDGAVTMALTPDRPRAFAINLRIPGWAQNRPVPSDLYGFADRFDAAPTIAVNGNSMPLTTNKGYVRLNRSWKAGDRIDLVLPMPVRRVVAHPKVVADRDRVALQRGPIVYAAEWPDNPGGRVRNIVLPSGTSLTSEFRDDLLKGVQIVKGRAMGLALDEHGNLTRHEQDFVAIPYATWANRGPGEMAVWLARTDAAAKATPYPTVATTSRVTTSPSRKDPRFINDGEEPPSSSDMSAYFDWWPTLGCPLKSSARCSSGEWVEMTFAKPATVSETAVYWFDDTGQGAVRVPASWRLLYKDGDQWTAVNADGPFPTQKDSWNRVRFSPVTTTALRIELTMQPGVSAGLQEWRVAGR
ncbi:MAG: beta-L-arabinofuranosidase domain-containing protein [Vicinamibacterales bacterium]